MSTAKSFLNKSEIYLSGQNLPDNLEDCACFSLIDGYDHIIKKSNKNGSFFIEKLDESYSGNSFTTIIKEHLDYIKKANKIKPLIVIDYNVFDTLSFLNPKRDEGLLNAIENYAKAQGNPTPDIYAKGFLSNHNTVSESFNSSRFISFNLEDKKLNFLSLSRYSEMAKEINLFKQDIFMKENNIAKNDVLLSTFYHEMGHFFDENFIKNTSSDYDKHKSEVFAETYAALMSIKRRKDTKYVEFMRNNRNNAFLKSAFSVINGDFKNPTMDFQKYNLTKPLDYIVKNFAGKEEKLSKISHNDMLKLCFDITEKSTISKEAHEKMGEEIKNHIVGTEIKDNLIIQNDFFLNNGYPLAENVKDFNDLSNKKANETKTHTEIKIEKELEQQFFASLSEKIIKDEVDFNTSFINTFSEMNRQIITDIAPDNFDISKIKLDRLNSILTEDREILRPKIFFASYYESIKTDEKIRNMDGEKALNYYMAFKKNYNKKFGMLVNKIKSQQIDLEAEKLLKSAIKSAKFAHLSAVSANAFLDANPLYKIDGSIKSIIRTDSFLKQPRELEELFKNRTPYFTPINENVLKTALNNRKKR